MNTLSRISLICHSNSLRSAWPLLRVLRTRTLRQSVISRLEWFMRRKVNWTELWSIDNSSWNFARRLAIAKNKLKRTSSLLRPSRRQMRQARLSNTSWKCSTYATRSLNWTSHKLKLHSSSASCTTSLEQSITSSRLQNIWVLTSHSLGMAKRKTHGKLILRE